jgi:hypothetical protein
MTSEPPEDAKPFWDFTHRTYRPDHESIPTPKGVPYNEFFSPQKLGSMLFKIAAKKLKFGNRPAKGKLPAGKGIVTHGRK